MSKGEDNTVKLNMRKMLLGCAGLALAFSLTACGGSGDSSESQNAGDAPQAQEAKQTKKGSMQGVMLDQVSLEVPEGWVKSPAEDFDGDWTEGYDDSADAPTIRVRVAPEINDSPHPDVVEADLAARGQVGGFYGDEWKGGKREKADIDGASRGFKADFTYVADDGSQMRGRWILMTDPETNKVVTIEIAGEQETLSDDLLNEIADSIELKPGK